jgi:hypothetical protein
MPLPIMLGGLMEDMQEQAEKVHEVIRAAVDGKHIRTSSCARCYQDGERDGVDESVRRVSALPVISMPFAECGDVHCCGAAMVLVDRKSVLAAIKGGRP